MPNPSPPSIARVLETAFRYDRGRVFAWWLRAHWHDVGVPGASLVQAFADDMRHALLDPIMSDYSAKLVLRATTAADWIRVVPENAYRPKVRRPMFDWCVCGSETCSPLKHDYAPNRESAAARAFWEAAT
ncbi:hypothetical protein [Pendulispora albinea]|uniref:Uncharacterized protein n=1 Tax=Pendulispora albinea TaxID=2741071 RepID=A0ABZ2LX04_9BACT